jgi:branched-subunit amino acid transport protein AzlD
MTLYNVWFIQDSGLFSVWFRQVYTGFWFIQCLVQTGLYRILVYSVFGSDKFIQDSGLFSVWFRQVYTGFWFIQCLVQTSLYRILVYSVFGSDKFHCISCYYLLTMYIKFLHMHLVFCIGDGWKFNMVVTANHSIIQDIVVEIMRRNFKQLW